MKSWFIYILKCADNTLYTGSTNDLEKRVKVHNEGKTAAKYTRARRPVKMVYSEEFKTKSKALKREWEIKKMEREKKIEIIKKGGRVIL